MIEFEDLTSNRDLYDAVSVAYKDATLHATGEGDIAAGGLLSYIGVHALDNSQKSWREAMGLAQSLCMDVDVPAYRALYKGIQDLVRILNVKLRQAEASGWTTDQV